MEEMRRPSAVFFVLACALFVLTSANPAEAANVAAVNGQMICPAGSTGDPSGSKTFTTSSSPSALNAYLQRVVMCPNACYNVKVALSFSYPTLSTPGSLTITTGAVNACKKSNNDPAAEDRGCSKGQTSPTVFASSPAIPTKLSTPQSVGPKSRCDPAVAQTISAFGQGDIEGGFNSLANLEDPNTTLDLSAKQTAAPVNLGTAAGSGQVAQELSIGAGIPLSQAQELVASNPQGAVAAVNAISKGDPAVIQTTMTALNLDPSLANTVDLQAKIAANNNLPQPDQPPQNGDPSATFDPAAGATTGLPTQCGVSGLAGNFMLAESKCGANTYSATTNVIGPYQFLCSTWQNYANATGNGQYSDCSNANDPVISSQVVNAMNDMYTQKYGDTCTGAGLTLSSCLYAIHVFGEGGFNKMLNAYSADPNASAAVLQNVLGSSAFNNNLSIFRNGGTVAGVFAELDARLTGTTVIGNYVASPFSGILSSSNNGGYIAAGYTGYSPSPFANVTPTGYPTGGTVGGVQTASTQPLTSSALPTTAAQGASLPIQQPQPVATIIAQPNPVSTGSPVTVSWSSVGMQTQTPCRLSLGSAALAQANEGSMRVPTTASSTNPLVFSLQCTAASGASVSQTASVPLR